MVEEQESAQTPKYEWNSSFLNNEDNKKELISFISRQICKRRKTAGNKVGFESLCTNERPWVFCAEEDGVEVLMCILCTTYKPVGVGQRCWVDYGSRTLRKDALLLHEKSMQHRDAVRAAMSHKREQADGINGDCN